MKEYFKKFQKEFPVLTILGPRQSGKTSLARDAFPDLPYANLESPREREFAISDPEGFLAQFKEGAIVDEIQRAPDLLSYIQVRVDESRRKGEFILTGSHQFLLINSITQSLAGRTSILNLLPMSLEELHQANLVSHESFAWHDHVFRGFYPALQGIERDIPLFHSSYIETYVQRDLREFLKINDLMSFQNFLRLCATRVGQILNKDSLSRDAGLSPKTVEAWLSVLEASFIIFRLPPYFQNVGKRLIKSPKLYFYDVGIAAHLLGITERSHVSAHPMAGALFENLIVSEAMKFYSNRGRRPGMFFYRDSNDNEIDLLIEVPALKLRAIEIKSSMTYSPSFCKGLRTLKKMMPDKIERQLIILGGGTADERTEFSIYPWNDLESKAFGF